MIDVTERRSIFITGAASGIGLATARLFLNSGWFVGGYDVDEARVSELSTELGTNGTAGSLDVRDKAAVDRCLAEFVTAAGGRLDIMFNNAGIAVAGNLDDVPFGRLRDVVDINLMGVLNGMHAAIPHLATTPNSLCFTTASSAAVFGTAGMAVYGATKAAVRSLTEALSVELARYDSRAADVAPGIIDTPLWESDRFGPGSTRKPIRNLAKANVERTDAGRTVAPEEVAACVLAAYSSDRLHWYVPEGVADNEIIRATEPERLRDQGIAGIRAAQAAAEARRTEDAT